MTEESVLISGVVQARRLVPVVFISRCPDPATAALLLACITGYTRIYTSNPDAIWTIESVPISEISGLMHLGQQMSIRFPHFRVFYIAECGVQLLYM